MRNKFNKQLTKEFNQSFKPTIDKELLKEELNIKPKEIKCYSFKKKQFIAFTLSCVLLIVAITSITTWAITKNQMFNNNGTNEQTEDVDVVKMFEEKYKNFNIKIVSKIETNKNIKFSVLHVKSKEKSFFVIYFLNMPNNISGEYLLNVNINDCQFSDEIIHLNDYLEYDVELSSNYIINLQIIYQEHNIFEFCTTV